MLTFSQDIRGNEVQGLGRPLRRARNGDGGYSCSARLDAVELRGSELGSARFAGQSGVDSGGHREDGEELALHELGEQASE